MKTIILITLLGLGFSHNALALQCGGKIIQEGDSVAKVMKYCNIEDTYNVNNALADQRYLYDVKGGREHQITVIDGHVTDIQQ